MELVAAIVSLAVILFVFVKLAQNSKKKYSSYQITSKSKPHQKSVSKIDISCLPERFVVFDFETTGLDAGKCEIIEVAAIKANRDSNQHDYIQALVLPQKKIPKKITDINGITQEMVENDGEPIEKVITEFLEFIGPLPLVAYNAKFDVSFLKAATGKANIMHPGNEVFCALTMARKAWPDLISYRLADIARSVGGGNLKSHRALDDCQKTLIIFGAAAAELKSISYGRSF